MKYLLSILVFFTISNLLGQAKQDYIWLFGVDEASFPTETGYIFDFTSNTTTIEENDNNIGISSANASICDAEGNLLFYMNGCAVMNREYEMMANGDSLGYDIWWDVFNWPCEIGQPGNQDNIILTNPAEKKYYIIHKPRIYNGNGNKDSIPVWYSIVDMSEDGGLGDIIEKNRVLDESEIFLSSYLTAINHENGKDWWIIQAPVNDSLFHIYIIDEEGIRLDQIQNSHHYMTRNRTSASGTAKFSSDGTKYAWYNYYDQLNVYDFNRATGILSNHQKIQIIPEPDNSLLLSSSLEWSPNSRFIYAASSDVLYQVDLWEEDIQADGIRLIDTYNGTQDPFSTTFFLMAQAPDCKIYMCPTSGTRSYHVIKKPNELGIACEFVQNGVKLPQLSNFGGMPNFPRFRVDKEEKCDPTLTSVFGNTVYYRRDLEVYPSPSDGLYTVQIPNEFYHGKLSVINLEGNLIDFKEISIGTLSVKIDITKYPSGYYHIELYPEKNVDRLFWGTQVVKE